MNVAITQVTCPNPKCGQVFLNSHETFCPECGTRLPEPDITKPLPFVVASRSSRIWGFVIDFLISIIAAVVLLVPVGGQILAAVIWAGYFLFRDINGASPGKMIFGNTVISKNGRLASTGQKTLRNVLLVLPELAEWIPIAGLVAGPVVWLVVLCVEALSLLTTGERLGDKIAGTMVVKRSR